MPHRGVHIEADTVIKINKLIMQNDLFFLETCFSRWSNIVQKVIQMFCVYWVHHGGSQLFNIRMHN